MFPTDASKTTPIEVEHHPTLAHTDQAAARPARSRPPAHGPIGYARTRLDPADLRQAVIELNALGVHSENIHIDTGPAGPLPNLKQALEAIPSGGTLVAASLARLARSVAHLTHLVDHLDAQRAKLQIGSDTIDQLSATRMLHLMAELELQLVDGQLADATWTARQRRDPRGGKPVLTPIEELHLRQLFDAGLPRRELGHLFGISKATVYRLAGVPIMNELCDSAPLRAVSAARRSKSALIRCKAGSPSTNATRPHHSTPCRSQRTNKPGFSLRPSRTHTCAGSSRAMRPTVRISPCLLPARPLHMNSAVK